MTTMCDFCIPCSSPGNGHRLFFTSHQLAPFTLSHEGSLEGRDPRNAVCFSNLFPFNNFRTPLRDRNAPNSFLPKRLRTTSFTTAGWGVSALALHTVASRSPLTASLCFQRLTHCPICKPFVFITLQQCGGG